MDYQDLSWKWPIPKNVSIDLELTWLALESLGENRGSIVLVKPEDTSGPSPFSPFPVFGKGPPKFVFLRFSELSPFPTD